MKHLIIPGVLLLLLFSSVNLTAQWVQSSNGITGLNVTSFTSQGNNLYVASSVHLYISSDNGTAWTDLNQPGDILASNSMFIFSGISWNSGGLNRSSDNGTTWSFAGPYSSSCIRSLAANENNIYTGIEVCAQANSAHFWTSSNNGANWIERSFTYLANRVISLAVNGNNVFAGTSIYGIFKSTDNGTTWAQTLLNNQRVYSLAVNGNNVFAGTSSNGVYRSTDNGTTWTQTSLNNQLVYSLVVSGNNIFAGTDQNGVYLSTDNGFNWNQRNEGLSLSPINALYIFNNYILAGTGGSGVYRRSLSELIGINPISSEIPNVFALYQNYPNPFNPVTKIKFALPPSPQGEGPGVRVTIYDILGKEVTTLVNEQLKSSTYEVEWDATNYPSGAYYYKLVAGSFVETKKMVLLR